MLAYSGEGTCHLRVRVAPPIEQRSSWHSAPRQASPTGAGLLESSLEASGSHLPISSCAAARCYHEFLRIRRPESRIQVRMLDGGMNEMLRLCKEAGRLDDVFDT